MLGAMVRRAQRDKRVWMVIAALGARDNVMDIEKRSVSATWYDATSTVASQDEASGRGWDILVGTNAFVSCAHLAVDSCGDAHVGAHTCHGSHMLDITARHLDDV